MHCTLPEHPMMTPCISCFSFDRIGSCWQEENIRFVRVFSDRTVWATLCLDPFMCVFSDRTKVQHCFTFVFVFSDSTELPQLFYIQRCIWKKLKTKKSLHAICFPTIGLWDNLGDAWPGGTRGIEMSRNVLRTWRCFDVCDWMTCLLASFLPDWAWCVSIIDSATKWS